MELFILVNNYKFAETAEDWEIARAALVKHLEENNITLKEAVEKWEEMQVG